MPGFGEAWRSELDKLPGHNPLRVQAKDLKQGRIFANPTAGLSLWRTHLVRYLDVSPVRLCDSAAARRHWHCFCFPA